MCKVKGEVKGKPVVLQTMGYAGKREAKTPVGDIRQARTLILYKHDAKGLGVKPGSRVTVKVGRKKIPCEAKRWSRGSILLVPKKEKHPFANMSLRSLKKHLVV